MLDGDDNFTDVEPCFVFRKLSFELDLLAKVSAWAVLHNEIQSVLVLEGVVQSNNELMLASYAQNVSFSDGVSSQVLLDNLLFLKDLHSVEVLRGLVALGLLLGADQVDKAEGSISQLVNNLKVIHRNLLAQVVAANKNGSPAHVWGCISSF